jgi:hypothetical protein
MAQFSRVAIAHFEKHHGIASTSQLLEAGLTVHGIRTLVDAGNLDLVLRGAYRLPAVPLDEPGRCVAVCAAHADVVVSGPTAGRLWGFRRIPADRRIHVLAPPHSQRTISQWVVPYRTSAIHAEDVLVRLDGIRLTSRERTALDLARSLKSVDLLSVIEQAMSDGRLTADDMRRVAVEWLSPRRPWLRSYLETLDRRLKGGAADSHHEVILGEALEAAGIQGLVRQFQVDLPGYGPARFDLAVPELCLAIEIDVFPTHSETAGRRSDEWRDRSANEIGWRVDRVVESDFGHEFGNTVQRLVRVHRQLLR